MLHLRPVQVHCVAAQVMLDLMQHLCRDIGTEWAQRIMQRIDDWSCRVRDFTNLIKSEQRAQMQRGRLNVECSLNALCVSKAA
jgi:hypothetical protein